MTRPSELTSFLSDLEQHRSRLSALIAGGEGASTQTVFDEVSELSERLLAADEELRAQSDEIFRTRADLETLAGRYEDLFAAAPTPLVITDVNGVMLHRNRAAAQLLDESGRKGPRPIATRFVLEDRRAIRTLIVRAVGGDKRQTARARLARPDAPTHVIEATVRAFTDEISHTRRLRWSLAPVAWHEDAPGVMSPGTVAERSTAEAALDLLLDLIHEELAWNPGARPSPEQMLERAVALAKRHVPGAEYVSLSERVGESLVVAASSQLIAGACDRLQTELGEGPIIIPASSGQIRRSDDLAHDDRWPIFGRRAAEMGMLSLITCELPSIGAARATLTLYASEAWAFSPTAELMIPFVALSAARAQAYADKVRNLERALTTRQVIGQAVGILMERYRISDKDSFDMLVRASQLSNCKLRELASYVVQTGETPHGLEPGNIER